MSFESEKIMFEIYRETAYNGRYKVVYFTELGDHNREHEINRAMAGEHYHDGFMRSYRRAESKQVIKKILERLNNGECVSIEEITAQIASIQPQPISS